MAKNKLINSIKVASEFISSLPIEFSPERTENREGFAHPYNIIGNEEETKVSLIIRDFELKKLENLHNLLNDLAKKTIEKYQKLYN